MDTAVLDPTAAKARAATSRLNIARDHE